VAAHPAEKVGLEVQAAGAGRGLERLLNVRFWPLGVVLAIQAVLSLRLVWSATAYIDEGLYLSVGHLELNHFLHHAAMPNVASFMSGSPVVYPPLAALADDIGGLAGARILSLVFMLVATTALHGVSKRLLFSRPAAFFAAALFAWLGTAQFLGAFATYDAMALMLLTVATWLGVRAVELDDDALRYTLVCAAGLCMAVADAAKYAAVLFNPVVIVVVALAAWRADGRKAGLDTAGAMLLTVALPLTIGYDLGGSQYAQGISSTTLERAASTATVQQVLDWLPSPLAYNSVLTTIRVLERKGHVRHMKDGRAHVFEPVIGRDDATRSEIRHLVGRFFRNSHEALVLNILQDEKLDARELKQLRGMLGQANAKGDAK